MSWQPCVRATRPPSGNRTGVATTEADCGACDRHLDDRDLVVRRLAARHRSVRAVRRDVEVDLLGGVRTRDERVGVRPAVGLDGLDVLGLSRVADVEDADALPVECRTWPARSELGAVAARVAAEGVDRQEQQVAVDRDVVLRAGADDLHDLRGLPRVLDVVDREAVVVAGEGVVARERQVAVVRADVGEGTRLREVGQQVHVLAAGLLASGERDVCGGRRRGDRDAQTEARDQHTGCSERSPAGGSCAGCGT